MNHHSLCKLFDARRQEPACHLVSRLTPPSVLDAGDHEPILEQSPWAAREAMWEPATIVLGLALVAIGALFWSYRRLASRLRDREEALRVTLDALPVMIAHVDAGGRVRYVNRAWDSWVGTTLGDARFQVLRDHAARALAGDTVETRAILPRDGHG